MKKITLFYRDFGSISGAVAQRGNYFAEAVLQHRELEDVDLVVYCANVGKFPPRRNMRIDRVFSLNKGNRSSFFARILDEILVGIHVGIKSALRRSDLFVISTPPYISGLIISLFQLTFGQPFALDVRDMYPRAYLDAHLIREGGLAHRLFNILTRFVLKRAVFIVCATQGQAREINELTDKVMPITIYNGFPKFFLDIKRPKREGFRVVTHGNLGIYQNVEFVLALAKSLEQDDVEFVIIGHGIKGDLVSKVPGKNFYLGELPFDQVIEQIVECDVGLCVRDDSPQSRYSFPVKAWEYIGLKMPTLIYPRCEVSDVFPDLEGLFTFDTLNIEDFRLAILNLRAQKRAADGVLALRGTINFELYTREALAKKLAEQIF